MGSVPRTLPARDELTILFAHAAYQMAERFTQRATGIKHFQVRSPAELKARIGEADVLVISGLWRNELIEIAPRLAFIQSISAGVDQYGLAALTGAGIRLATLARGFDMQVIGVKRDPTRGAEAADRVVAQDRMLEVLPEADFVALTCPLTAQTTNLFDARAFAAMKPHASLVNVARGAVVDEAALVAALEQKQIAAAAIDCVREEPLPASAALWGVPNLLITPHTAGETRKYEDNVIGLLLENLDRQWRGETVLKNDIA